MRNVMIIPAKGFSRRIHEKNLRPFCGMPLVEWSILQGVTARTIDEVWVSTNDKRIARLAEKHGASVFWRQYNDDEDTPGYVPIQEWGKAMLEDGTLDMDDGVVNRLCTTPHLKPDDIDHLVDMFWRNLGTYNAKGISVGAQMRTHICSKVIARGIGENIPDATCHNTYGIAHHLAFLGMNRARAIVGEEYETTPPNPDKPKLGYYYTVDPWQMQDCDSDEEWIFGELVMEHYILKGRTPEEVYDVRNAR